MRFLLPIFTDFFLQARYVSVYSCIRTRVDISISLLESISYEIITEKLCCVLYDKQLITFQITAASLEKILYLFCVAFAFL